MNTKIGQYACDYSCFLKFIFSFGQFANCYRKLTRLCPIFITDLHAKMDALYANVVLIAHFIHKCDVARISAAHFSSMSTYCQERCGEEVDCTSRLSRVFATNFIGAFITVPIMNSMSSCALSCDILASRVN
jgi:hypothetical protein